MAGPSSSSPASEPPASDSASQSPSKPASGPPGSESPTYPASETPSASPSQRYSSQGPSESPPQSQTGPGGGPETSSEGQSPTYPVNPGGSPTGHHGGITLSSGVTLTVTYEYGDSTPGPSPTPGGPVPGGATSSASGTVSLAGSGAYSSFADLQGAIRLAVVMSGVIALVGVL